MTRRIITSPWPDPGLVEVRWPGGIIKSPWSEGAIGCVWPVEVDEGGGPAPFDPLSLSPTHRWRASQGAYQDLGGTTTPAGVGDPLGTWRDEIADVDLIAPFTGARSPISLIGSTAVVGPLDGSDDTLISALDAIGIPTGGATIWGVVTFTGSGRPWDRVQAGNVDRMMVNQSAEQVQYYVSGRIINAPVSLNSGAWMVPAATVDLSDVHTYLNGVENGSGNEAVGSGITDLRLGSSNAGSSFYNGQIVEILLFDTKLTASEIRNLQSYAHDTYGDDLGVPAPLDTGNPLAIPSLAEYLDARALGDTLTDGDPVATWGTSKPGGSDATQTVVADRPAYRAAGIGTGPSVELDGVSDNILWLPSLSVETHTLQFLVQLDSLSGDQRIVDCSTGRLLLRVKGTTGALEVLSGGSGYIDTGETLSAGTPYLLTLRFRGADDECDLWLDRTEVASDLTYDPVDFRTSTRLGSGVGADRDWLDGHIGLAAAYDGALTDAEVEAIYDYVSASWGI